MLGPVLVLRFRSAQFVKRYIVSERKPQRVNSMNTRDRLEALRRIPEYHTDFKKWRPLVRRVEKHNKKTIVDDL